MPQACLTCSRWDTGSIRGHYQGGLELSWDGSPLLKSIYVGVHGVGTCVHHNVHTWFTWSDLGVLGQEL